MKLRDFIEIDYILFFSIITLLILGIFFIYSSGVTSTGNLVSNEYIRQIIWASIGIAAAIVLSIVNYRKFYDIALYLYLFSMVPLLYTFFFGRVVHSTRWLRIGSFGIQASEFAKIAVIIMLARYLADTERDNKSFFRFFICCMIVFIPMGIVLSQPDLGTALVFISILLSMTFVSGILMRYLLFIGSCIVFSGFFLVLPLWQTYIFRKNIPAIAALANSKIIILAALFLFIIAAIAMFGFLKFKKRYFYWLVYITAIMILSLGASYAARLVLKNYQIMRLIVFLDPNVDPRGAGWNIIQSITAIGSGGLTGMGFLQGTQSHYRYLPEQSTDFIFSIFSEETGFLGGLVVFALFFIICQRLLRIMKTTTDPFAVYVCAGLAGMFCFHFLVNVGMTMGIMPITGIPLLFMSYGGSAVLAAMIGVGLALSIHIRRYSR
ncbi:MAG: rod shape-determining protein RodA [Treponema sp.]|jgi:rod shape determining protein RodA|nr:rod shape-determining protein RodA [Treponema sp.]